MNLDAFPRLLAYGWPNESSGYTFAGPNGYVDVKVSGGDLGALFQLMDGRRRLREIADEANVGHETAVALVARLGVSGIVAEGSRQYRHYQRISENPARSSAGLTWRAMHELTRSSVDRAIAPDSADVVELTPTSRAPFKRNPTCRLFSGAPVSLADLSDLLNSMAGGESPRATPAAGGFYSTVVHVLVLVGHPTLAAGVYRHYPRSNCVARTQSLPPLEDLVRSFDCYRMAETASVIITISVNMSELGSKYGNRGYRYGLVEVGHVAQNAQLFCAERGLGVFEYGGFLDKPVEQMIALSDEEFPVVALGVGWPGDLYAERNGADAGYGASESAVESALPRVREQLFENGVVERLSILPPDPSHHAPFNVAIARYANPGTVDNPDRTTGGSGLTRSEAEIKALAEAAERFACGLFRVDRVEKFTELDAAAMVPSAVLPLSGAQRHRFKLAEFDVDTPWEWVGGVRELDGSACYAAVDNVFYPIDTGQLGRRLAGVVSSNGVAAHSDFGKAKEFALLELVERDAVMMAWLTRRTPPRIALRSLPDDVARRVEFWKAEGYTLHILDLSVDSCPAVLAAITSPTRFPYLSTGAASGLTHGSAIRHAVREAERLQRHWLASRSDAVDSPEDVWSPIDHGRYYLRPDRLASLDWLFGGPSSVLEENAREGHSFSSLVELFDPVYVDLTGGRDLGGFHVVRALSTNLVPVTFGCGLDCYSHPRVARAGASAGSQPSATPHFFT